MLKNLPAVWVTWVQSLGWEDPLEEGMATHSSILAWRIPMDRGAWRAAVCEVTTSRTLLSDKPQHSKDLMHRVRSFWVWVFTPQKEGIELKDPKGSSPTRLAPECPIKIQVPGHTLDVSNQSLPGPTLQSVSLAISSVTPGEGLRSRG